MELTKTSIFSKYTRPEAIQVGRTSESLANQLKLDVRQLIHRAQQAGDCLSYADSWVADLTEFESALQTPSSSLRWAGSPSYRGVRESRSKERFGVRRCGVDELNDSFHNKTKSWAQDSRLLEYFRSLGQLGKVTLAILKPGGWWPSHYDFGPRHGFKLNYVVETDVGSTTLIWNNRDQKMTRVHMQSGELWWINVGMRHSAHNWGEKDRIHVLLTYRDEGILNCADLG